MKLTMINITLIMYEKKFDSFLYCLDPHLQHLNRQQEKKLKPQKAIQECKVVFLYIQQI